MVAFKGKKVDKLKNNIVFSFFNKTIVKQMILAIIFTGLFFGVVVYKELFTSTHLISFSFIWVALIIYSLSNTQILKRQKVENQDIPQ